MEIKIEEERKKKIIKEIFKKYDFERLFQGLKLKQEKSGKIVGFVKMNNIKESEVRALQEIGLYKYRVGEDEKVSIKELKIFLTNFSLGESSIKNLIEEYFNRKIVHKKILIDIKEKRISNFFSNILDEIKDERVEEYFIEIFKEKKYVYKKIIKEWKDDEEKLKKKLLYIIKALENLPSYKKKYENLPIFSNLITGDPHFFDLKGGNFILLMRGIENIYKLKESENLETNYENLYHSGLLKDEISNYIIISGFKGIKRNNQNKEYSCKILEGINDERESIIYSLSNILKVDRLIPLNKDKKIIIVENPSVFSRLFRFYSKKYKVVPTLICTYGQLNLSAYLFLKKLGVRDNIYYSGDLDPGGLIIAQKLIERFPHINLLKFDKKTYMKYLSNITIDEIGISKIKNIKSLKLLELKESILKEKIVVYQESFIREIEAEV